MTRPSLKALLSPFPFKFLPSNAYEPFVNRVPQLVLLQLVQFFDFLFLNPMCPLVSEAIEHDLFGNGCAMPHGFGQLPVEFGSSTVGVSPTCAPAIDASGFNYVEMHAPIAAFADVPSYAVNVDGVDVELLLGHRFPPLFWSCQVFVIDFPWSRPLGRRIATIARGPLAGFASRFLLFREELGERLGRDECEHAGNGRFHWVDLYFGHYWDTAAVRH
jgi:hypothetical protein